MAFCDPLAPPAAPNAPAALPLDEPAPPASSSNAKRAYSMATFCFVIKVEPKGPLVSAAFDLGAAPP